MEKNLLIDKDFKVDITDQSYLRPMIDSFLGWLDKNGYAGYDAYDLWATRYGIFSRKIYYKNKFLSAPFVAPVVLAEMLCPGLSRLFLRRHRFAIADAHFILGYLNLFSATKEERYLKEATKLSDELLGQSVSGYSGICWGYPFDWQNNRGLWKKGTPFVTVTPYGMEAMLALYDATKDKKYLDQALSSAQFILKDIRDTKTSDDASACSYSPLDESKVVNASAYRAFALTEAFHRSQQKEFQEKALRNLNFVLQSQKPDGSWLYAEGNSQDAFIDNFHTCFVLKNLCKLNRHLKSADVEGAIIKGYGYYRKQLFDKSGEPKPFAGTKSGQFVRYELYDFAEAITLGTLLKEKVLGAFELSKTLAEKVMKNYQLRDGHFVTRVYKSGTKNSVPYIRWPQAQMFYALTSLLKEVSG